MKLSLFFSLLFASTLLCAQQKTLYLHPEISTHILLPEGVVSVDISTQNVAIHQPSSTLLLIKPIGQETSYLGVLSIVCESFLVQFELYSAQAFEADRLVPVSSSEGFLLPSEGLQLSGEQMKNLALRLLTKKARKPWASVKKESDMFSLTSVHVTGEYLFLEVAVENKGDVPLLIQGVDFVIKDKKGGKRTNSQELHLNPVYTLLNHGMMQKRFRNVYVLKAARYPGDKVLELRLKAGEYGLTFMHLTLPYQKLLAADSF